MALRKCPCGRVYNGSVNGHCPECRADKEDATRVRTETLGRPAVLRRGCSRGQITPEGALLVVLMLTIVGGFVFGVAASGVIV